MRANVVLILSLCALSGNAFAWSLRLKTDRPARAFAIDEKPTFHITVIDPDNTPLAYEVSRNNELLESGSTPLEDGCVTLQLKKELGYGHYFLKLSQGERRHDDAFCVIRLADPAEPGPRNSIFGISLARPGKQSEAAIQLGARWARSDAAWPQWQPAAGRYDLDKFLPLWEELHSRGMRICATVGYSPQWCGYKPVDAEGRPAIAWHTWPYRSNIEWHNSIKHFFETAAPFIEHVESWNEVDISFGYLPSDRHGEMMKITGAWMRRSYPHLRQINGASASWSWTDHAVAQRSVEWLDYQNTHYASKATDAMPTRFRDGQPDYQIPHYVQLAYQPYEKHNWWLPLVCVEDSTQSPDGLMKAFIGAAATRQARYWIHFTMEMEGYGIVLPDGHGDYMPDPQYAAYATVRALVEPALVLGRLWPQNQSLRCYVMAESDGTILAALWPFAPEQAELELPLEAGSGEIIDLLGATTPVKAASAKLIIGRREPRYVRNVDQRVAAAAIADQVNRRYTGWRNADQGMLWNLKQPPGDAIAYTQPLCSSIDAQSRPPIEKAIIAIRQLGGAELAGEIGGFTRYDYKPWREVNIPERNPDWHTMAELLHELQQAYLDAAITACEQNDSSRLPAIDKTVRRVLEAAAETGDLWRGASLIAGNESETTVSREDAARLRARYQEMISRPVLDGWGEKPRYLSLLRNYADWYLGIAENDNKPEYLKVAEASLTIAESFFRTEQPRANKLLLTVDFPPAGYVVKGYTLYAGTAQEIQVNAHNFADMKAEGVLKINASKGISVEPNELAFSVDSGMAIGYIVRVALPEDCTGGSISIEGKLDKIDLPRSTYSFSARQAPSDGVGLKIERLPWVPIGNE